MIPILFVLMLDSVKVPGGPHNIAAGDVNRDGRMDLIVACKDDIAVLLNTKKGWKLETRIPPAWPPSDLVSGDFNGDGFDDVAMTDHDSFRVTLLFADGKGWWKAGGVFQAKKSGAPHVHGLVPVDLNGDGAKDLLFASSGEGELIALLNSGQGALKAMTPVKAAENAWHPAVADFNNDGRPDAVTATFGGKGIAVVLGDGKGGFAPAPGSPHDVFPRSFLVKTADLNKDGNVDIFGVHDDHGRVTILLGDGKGGFTQATGSPYDIGREAYGIEAIDLDRDGWLDLATAAGKELRVFRQTKPGVFEGPVVRATGVGSFRIIAHDFDGDGHKELAIPDPDGNRIVFFR